ncbi:uncharacterized protein LOC144040537 [Vanacampus margaritifer]
MADDTISVTSVKSCGMSDGDEILQEATEEKTWRHIRLCVAQQKKELKQQIKKQKERMEKERKERKVREMREKKEREKQEKKERKEQNREKKDRKKLLKKLKPKKNLSFCNVTIYLFTGDQQVTLPFS